MPESAVETLGRSVGGINYRRYAHRAPLAFRVIMPLPQPTAFTSVLSGSDGSARAAGGGSQAPADATDPT